MYGAWFVIYKSSSIRTVRVTKVVTLTVGFGISPNQHNIACAHGLMDLKSKHRRWGISPRPEDNCSLDLIIASARYLSIYCFKFFLIAF